MTTKQDGKQTPDITSTRKILGWEPKVSLEEGLARTSKWIEERCRKNRKRRW